MFSWPQQIRKQSITDLCGPGLAPQWIVRDRITHREYCGLFALVGSDGTIREKLAGRVVEWRRLPVDVYIYDPPIQLRQHRHGRCLQLLAPNSKWFKLHWERPARTFDQARAYVEQLMEEAIGVATL